VSTTLPTASTGRRSVYDLPKAHLHCHLIPSARPETVRKLAGRYGIDVEHAWTFNNLTEFVKASVVSFEVIQKPDDLARICREFVEDEATQGVAYTQPMMGVGFFSRRFGLSPDEFFAIHDEAFRAASAATGVQVGSMFGILRHELPEVAERTARFAAERADRGVVAFGIAGDEQIGTFGQFSRAFEIAREAGLLVVPHAGESVGPESVRDALDTLRPNRIAHGVRAVEDPDLLRRLADEGITCDVCPTSNVKLGVVQGIELHQLPALLAAGVGVTLNADDQLFFGPKVAEEYELVRRVFGLTDAQLAEIARTSARTSGASPATVERMLRGIDAWLATPPVSDG
jgi:adenosine deaminase